MSATPDWLASARNGSSAGVGEIGDVVKACRSKWLTSVPLANFVGAVPNQLDLFEHDEIELSEFPLSHECEAYAVRNAVSHETRGVQWSCDSSKSTGSAAQHKCSAT